jgi:hypothetical protein
MRDISRQEIRYISNCNHIGKPMYRREEIISRAQSSMVHLKYWKELGMWLID